ncbi:hypothetical protein STIAU_3756 [Stigmatella aurantiaca DW4/3-1]|uniref:Uncharacterized protein n=1 Tax=Stigmatella aurantiaca (strain DW4/3-1) TaxID=378806 RepID=Q096G6_STIAD|nr:hypothetical protein STIAU_3756 [Stigmatella aurantiaca DW4/3-1]
MKRAGAGHGSPLRALHRLLHEVRVAPVLRIQLEGLAVGVLRLLPLGLAPAHLAQEVPGLLQPRLLAQHIPQLLEHLGAVRLRLHQVARPRPVGQVQRPGLDVTRILEVLEGPREVLRLEPRLALGELGAPIQHVRFDPELLRRRRPVRAPLLLPRRRPPLAPQRRQIRLRQHPECAGVGRQQHLRLLLQLHRLEAQRVEAVRQRQERLAQRQRLHVLGHPQEREGVLAAMRQEGADQPVAHRLVLIRERCPRGPGGHHGLGLEHHGRGGHRGRGPGIHRVREVRHPDDTQGEEPAHRRVHVEARAIHQLRKRGPQPQGLQQPRILRRQLRPLASRHLCEPLLLGEPEVRGHRIGGHHARHAGEDELRGVRPHARVRWLRVGDQPVARIRPPEAIQQAQPQVRLELLVQVKGAQQPLLHQQRPDGLPRLDALRERLLVVGLAELPLLHQELPQRLVQQVRDAGHGGPVLEGDALLALADLQLQRARALLRRQRIQEQREGHLGKCPLSLTQHMGWGGEHRDGLVGDGSLECMKPDWNETIREARKARRLLEALVLFRHVRGRGLSAVDSVPHRPGQVAHQLKSERHRHQRERHVGQRPARTGPPGPHPLTPALKPGRRDVLLPGVIAHERGLGVPPRAVQGPGQQHPALHRAVPALHEALQRRHRALRVPVLQPQPPALQVDGPHAEVLIELRRLVQEQLPLGHLPRAQVRHAQQEERVHVLVARLQVGLEQPGRLRIEPAADPQLRQLCPGPPVMLVGENHPLQLPAPPPAAQPPGRAREELHGEAVHHPEAHQQEPQRQQGPSGEGGQQHPQQPLAHVRGSRMTGLLRGEQKVGLSSKPSQPAGRTGKFPSQPIGQLLGTCPWSIGTGPL